MNWRQAAATRAADVFALDVRSLAAMRIGLAGVLLTDLAIRASDFEAMYSSAGFAPVDVVERLRAIPAWSLHFLNHADWYQATLFALAAALAAALLVGYRTRLATIGSWVLLASLHVRMPLATNAGDSLLRLLLFWSMFLPLGDVWSLDARRRGPPARLRVVSAGSVALIVQLALVYWLAGWAKWNDAWLHEDALGNVFKFGLYGLPLGAALADYPTLTQFASRAIVWFELLGPLLLFIPWRAVWWRMIALVGFVLLHAGIAATMTVGLFSYAAIAAWMGLVPGEVWNRIGLAADQRLPAPLAPWRCWASRCAAAICWTALGLAIYWNVAGALPTRPQGTVHRSLRTAAQMAALRQAWGVFGRPPRQDSWFVYQARLKNGELVDLLSGGTEILESKPALASRQFANHRWRKLHLRLRSPGGLPYRQPLADYMCRRWNAQHGPDEQIVRLDFYYYSQAFDLAGNASDHVREKLAQTVLAEEGGNFAEALRESENF